MTGRDVHQESELKIVTEIGREFERVLTGGRRGRLRRGLAFQRGRPAAALTVVLALAIAGGAGAASGLVPIGSIIQGGDPREHPEYRLNVDQTVLAEGTTPMAGRWRVTSYKSEELVDEGEVAQPAGLPCMRLVLLDPPKGTLVGGHAFCGDRGGFNAASLTVTDQSGRAEVLVFGQAPKEASAVELTADDTPPVRASMHEGPANASGDVWVIAAPPEVDARNPVVRWIGADGRSTGGKLAASRAIDANHQ